MIKFNTNANFKKVFFETGDIIMEINHFFSYVCCFKLLILWLNIHNKCTSDLLRMSAFGSIAGWKNIDLKGCMHICIH